jgi:hypothetical protein
MERIVIIACLILGLLAMAIGMTEPWPLRNPDVAFGIGAGLSVCPTILVVLRTARAKGDG